MSGTVWILTGSGPALGSGHLRRMRVLADLLRARGHAVELHFRTDVDDFESALPTYLPRPAPGDLCLVDARDADPRPFRKGGPVIALDNRHSSRPADARDPNGPDDDPGLIYYDTLPHPDADMAVIQNRFLVAPELREIVLSSGGPRLDVSGPAGPGRDLLAYSGASREVRALDEFLIRYARANPVAGVRRVGSVPVAANQNEPPPNFTHVDFLPPADFYAALHAAVFVLSYFGMTVLEAWYSGATPLLYSINSELHDRLSRDLSSRSGIAFIKSGSRISFDGLENRLATGYPLVAVDRALGPGPDGRGYERLVELVERTMG